MSDRKITQLTELTSGNIASNDLLVMVDVSDTTMAPSGTNKKGQVSSISTFFASATQTLTNKTISGTNNTLSNIGNSSLTNSSITFGSTSQALGSTVTALNGVSIGATTLTEGAFPVVTQTDIGTAPNQIPLNQYLSEYAYMSTEQFVVRPQTSANPGTTGGMVFELTSNTSLTIKVRGSDGVVRSVALTLA